MSNPFDAATPAMVECFESNQRAYAAGKLKPNYPPPATIENVERACNYMFLSTCPYGPSPCLICIEKFIDSIEIDYLDLD